jgi:phage protein D
VSEPQVHLQILLGQNLPVSAPFSVVDSLSSLEVTCSDRERSGFQMTFALDQDPTLEYELLKSGALDPPNRMIAVVYIGTQSQVLIDGIITNHQLVPSNDPGESMLHVTGEDISLKLDLVEKSLTFHNQSDSAIVENIISSYATLGLMAKVTKSPEAPPDVMRITTQQGTDLDFIRKLANRNGFIFYIEPAETPGINMAYWGPESREGRPQSALSMNMGPDTNVDEPLVFSFNALGPIATQSTIIETSTRASQMIPPAIISQPPLAARTALPMRSTLTRDTAKLNSIQAGQRGLSSVSQAANAVSATGEIDALRYGRVLLARRLVGVRGVGPSYDGNYYVKQVTHSIRRGEYKQKFTITRDGLGALSQVVAL